jgi:hypothetical protein
VIVYLVLQPFLPNLVETVELVEVNRVAVRHNHAVEGDGHTALLSESRHTDLLGLPQHDRSVRDKDMLVVVRVDGIRDKHLDRANGIAVQTIHQNRIQRHAFIDDVRLARCGVDVDLRRARLRLLWRLLTRCAGGNHAAFGGGSRVRVGGFFGCGLSLLLGWWIGGSHVSDV